MSSDGRFRRGARSSVSCLAFVVVAVGSVGCNALLDIERASGIAEDATLVDSTMGDAAADGGVDAPSLDVPADSDAIVDGALCDAGCPAGYACIEGRCGDQVRQIAMGYGTSCVVLWGGELWCWGDARSGVLGALPIDADAGAGVTTEAGITLCPGGIACRPRAAKIEGITDAVFAAVGRGAICAIDSHGALSCLGDNASDYLGHPSREGSPPDTTCSCVGCESPCNPEPRPVSNLPVPITRVSLGASNACALDVQRQVWCWGNNRNGNLGRGTVGQPISDLPGPIYTQVRTAFVDVSVGYDVADPTLSIACAVSGAGEVWCWGGDNAHGALGHDPSLDKRLGAHFVNPTPTIVAGLGNVVHVAVGSDHVCAIKAMGDVVCWGGDVFGQLGNGAPPDARPHVTPVAPLFEGRPLRAAGLSVSALDSYAVLATGQLLVWGSGGYFEIGDGDNNDRSTPTIAALLGDAGVARIGVGVYQVGVLTRTGELRLWGRSSAADLGYFPGDAGDVIVDGDELAQPTPVRSVTLP